MAAGYVRQSAANISSGLAIRSADLNAEFNQVQSAFDNTSGHNHTGTSTGVGAKIPLTAGVTGILPVANGGTGTATISAYVQSSPADPAATVSAVAVMAGLGVLVTPATTGRLLIIIDGAVSNSALTGQGTWQISIGTGVAPVNGAALTGTTVDGAKILVNSGVTNMKVPFSVAGISTGLTLNTQYWIDLAFLSTPAGTSTALFSVTVRAIEI